MSHRWGIGPLLVLVVAVVGRAQEAPEQLLGKATQVYLRWDGIAAHRAAYEKSALGKIMSGDTGKFVASALSQAQGLLGSQLTVQELLQGVPPDRLKTLLADAAEAPKILSVLGENGVIVAAEVRGLEPPQGQVTLIVPNAGTKPGPILGALRLVTALGKVPVKESKLDGRTVYSVSAPKDEVPVPLHFAWWVDGKHVVLATGTDTPEEMLKRAHQQKDRLTDNALYQKMADFKEFETAARAFIDVADLAELGRSRGEPVGKILDDLGLNAVKNLVFHSGFTGEAERSVMTMELAGKERKGVLALLAGKPFQLADVPPVAPDAISWSMSHFDLKVVYDNGLKAARNIVGLLSPDDLPKLDAAIKQMNDILTIDLRDDLLAALGDQVVTYGSPAEGPFNFGQTYLVRVKDPKKLYDALEQAIKGAGRFTGVDVSVEGRTYHGVEVRQVRVRQQGFIFAPTYAVHKGWLAVGLYPQSVHGYILRQEGQLPAWKPGPRARAAFEQLPKEFLGVSVSDPRPTFTTILSLAPVVAGAVNSFLPEGRLDVSLLPNAHEVNQHLFPNVSVVRMDGNTLRLETRASVALPVEFGSLDSLFLFALIGRVADVLF